MENSLSKYIILTEENMAKEHICCAFSDKKCRDYPSDCVNRKLRGFSRSFFIYILTL